MNRKVLGWNINQRSGLGREIPELVLQELLEQDADVIVLTEVVKNDSLPLFLQKMREAGYESAISKNENIIKLMIDNDFIAKYDIRLIDAAAIDSIDKDKYFIIKDNGHGVGSICCL